MVKAEHADTKDKFLRLWCHEESRVFRDRLISAEDRTWFNDALQVCIPVPDHHPKRRCPASCILPNNRKIFGGGHFSMYFLVGRLGGQHDSEHSPLGYYYVFRESALWTRRHVDRPGYIPYGGRRLRPSESPNLCRSPCLFVSTLLRHHHA